VANDRNGDVMVLT